MDDRSVDVLDMSRIAELKEEVGEDDFAEVVALFCEEVEEVLSELDTTPQETIAGKIHFLKGSVQNIGLAEVAKLCLEEEARLKSDPNARPDAARLRTAYQSSKDQLLG
ncbi:MAG: Hpt domain-containing protein [Paracoccaceae bacterium]|nr:Hpt domain-containing protein [Paracoccaceae bacterium]